MTVQGGPAGAAEGAAGLAAVGLAEWSREAQGKATAWRVIEDAGQSGLF
ncbi:hypothetical protein [Streptomyces sp. NPDC056661]